MIKPDTKAITEALSYMAKGEKYVAKDKTLSWVPATISEEKVQTFIQCVKEAYDQGSPEIDFEGTIYEVEFVKEGGEIRIAPGFAGKTNVTLNEQIIGSFHDVKQAKVFATYKEHALKTAPKKPFANTMVSSVRAI